MYGEILTLKKTAQKEEGGNQVKFSFIVSKEKIFMNQAGFFLYRSFLLFRYTIENLILPSIKK